MAPGTQALVAAGLGAAMTTSRSDLTAADARLLLSEEAAPSWADAARAAAVPDLAHAVIREAERADRAQDRVLALESEIERITGTGMGMVAALIGWTGPLDAGEVLIAAAGGPVALAKRVASERDAAIDGYRELGAKCASLEAELDAMRAAMTTPEGYRGLVSEVLADEVERLRGGAS